MEFYESMVQQFVEKVRTSLVPGPEELKKMAQELMKEASCQALWEIREVLKDDTLEDANCFMRIERIVEIYEAMGLDGGGRHDF